MTDHKEELQKVGQQLEIADLENKVQRFVTTYFDIWADGTVSEMEKKKFTFAGKSLKVKPETIEKLLKRKP